MRGAVFVLLFSSSAVAMAQPPELPDRSFSPDAVGTLVSPSISAGVHLNQPASVGGALLLAGNGDHTLWDIFDPGHPRLLSHFESPFHDGEAESHQLTFVRDADGTLYALMISGHGVDVFDLTDVTAPELVSSLELEGIRYGDNTEAVWGVAWLGDTIYVGGTNVGLFVVDATDPTALSVVTRIPTSELGGVDAGPLFVLGDTLVVTTPKERAGIATLDISDRRAPALLDSVLETTHSYIGGFYGHHALLITPYRAYDVTTDPRDIRLETSIEVPASEYVSFGDGHLFLGALRPLPGAYEYDVTDFLAPALLQRVVGRTDTFDGAFNDDQFTLPIGNLLVLCDDQISLGAVIAVRDDRRDEVAPEVLWASPPDGAVGRSPATSIALSFSDQIDLRSLRPDTLVVTDAAGTPVPGRITLTHTLVAFSPTSPLAPDTTYEVVLPAGGITDLVGNGIRSEWRRSFSTGTMVTTPDCGIGATTPVPVGTSAALSADDAGAGATYAWELGDGGTATGASVSHTFTAPGRYPVRLTVSVGGASRTCSATQIVHTPPAAAAPTRSSTVVVADGLAVTVAPDAGTVTAVSTSSLEVVWETAVGDDPASLAVAPDGSFWVTVSGSDTIAVLDPAGALLDTIALRHGAAPYGVAATPAGDAMVVTLEGASELLVLDPATRTTTRTVSLDGGPRSLAIAPDGSHAYVSRFLSPETRGEVFEVDLTNGSVVVLPLALDPGPDDGHQGRGVPNALGALAISPDGGTLLIPSKKDNVERGLARDGMTLGDDSTVRAIVSRIDLGAGAEELARRIDLDDHDMPSAVVFSPLGDLAFVASQGSNRVDVYDTASGRLVSGLGTSLAPQGLTIAGGRLYVQGFTSRALDVFDVSGLLDGTDARAVLVSSIVTVGTEPLTAEELLGEQIFYNADDPRMSASGYLSCATCHDGGGLDGRVWDFTDRGEGLRDTIDLRGRAGTAHGPVHWTGNFDEIQDFENDIRHHFGGRGLMPDDAFTAAEDTLGAPKAGASAALDALAAYVATFDEFPRSPHRAEDGASTALGVEGRAVFESLNCLRCHGGERLTDSRLGVLHDVGTLTELSGERLGETLTGIDTPTLRGVWATAPYFHDGSARTLEDALRRPGHGDATDLDDASMEALVAFLLELENEELGYPEPTLPMPTSGGGCGCTTGRRGPGALLVLLAALVAALARRR